MNTTMKLVVALFLIAGAGFAVVLLVRPSDGFVSHPANSTSPKGVPDTSLQGDKVQSAGEVPAVSLTTQPAMPDYDAQLSGAGNVWSVVEKILPVATSGDPEAQYFLWKALSYCTDRNRFFFSKDGKTIDLNEGLMLAASRQIPQQYAQEVFDKCREFREADTSEAGDARDWLIAAASAGQPNAQAAVAVETLSFDLMREMRQGNGVPHVGERIEIDRSPQELLQDAIKSRRPEVMVRVSESLQLLRGKVTGSDEGTDTDALAWLLLACQRGYDCTSNSDRVQFSCGYSAACVSYTDQFSLVRDAAGDNWHAVRDRARELGEVVDAGDWDKIDLGS